MSRFKILWIDDQPNKCTRDKRSISQIIESLGFEPDIDLESDISTASLAGPDGNLYRKIHGRDVDLFLIDYNLKNNIFGKDVISEIRKENEIYTDIIFYSSVYTDLVAAVKESYDVKDPINYLDGVYIAPLGDTFVEKVERVIRKIIKSWYNIHSIRGVILSKASKFEHMVSEIISLGYEPCLLEIKDKLAVKGERVLNSTKSQWEHVFSDPDPISRILEHPLNFNWAVKKLILDTMIENELIELASKPELENIFSLRNDFAHNPLHLEDGQLKLSLPSNISIYTEGDIENIRTELSFVEKDLEQILSNLKEKTST